MPSQFTPSKFSEETVPELPGGNLNTGQRTPVTVRKMKRKGRKPNAGFRAFSASKAPCGGAFIRLFGAALFLRGGFHDHTADLLGVGFVHDEPPAAALENFSLLRNMPGFKA